jgi:hypothetical protein
MVVVSRTCGLSLDTADGTVTDTCNTNVSKTDDGSYYCTESYFGEPGQTYSECPEGGACGSCKELFDNLKLSSGDEPDIFCSEHHL